MLSRPNKGFTAFAVSLFLLLSAVQVNASENTYSELQFTDSANQKVAQGVMLHTHADMQITGLINDVTVKQTFVNRHPFTVNAKYLYPLPSDSAVYSMSMQVGERKIVGKIAEKQAAAKQFQQAKRAGKRATLVEQQRANMFVSKMANLGPGEQLVVTLKYQQMLTLKNGTLSARLPTTFTPRYHGMHYQYDQQASQAQPNTAPSPLGQTWLEPKFVEQSNAYFDAIDANRPAQFTLNVAINLGLPLTHIDTGSYSSQIKKQGVGQYQIKVTDDEYNRDFVLSARIEQASQPRSVFLRQSAQSGDYGLLMLLPPSDQYAQEQRLPREVIFVIDSSGSMHGTSMEAAKQAMFYALDNLNPQDSFNIVDFDSHARLFRGQAVIANDYNRRAATQFIYSLDPDGGTNISGALNKALDGQNHEGYVRQVVFITDGSVSNEKALFSQIEQQRGDSRLFTVGIGSAPNGLFMRRAAHIGKGSFTFIADVNQVTAKMRDLFTRLENPALRDVHIHSERDEALSYWPKPLPDVYFGEPLMVAIKLPEKAQQLHIAGAQQSQPVQYTLPMHQGKREYAQSEAIARLWARQQIASLLLFNEKEQVKAQVLQLALAHQLLSPFTSFIAVDESTVREPAKIDEQVPNALAQGQSLMRFAQTDGQSHWHMLLGLLLLGFASVFYLNGRRHA